jgi:small multidrug resistance pump
MPKHYLFLIVAVLAETIGTSSIQASQQFTRLWPSVLAIISFAFAFYFLSLTLKVLPVGIMYAMWSGLGIIFIAIIGWVYFGQKLDLAAVFGMSLILAGIVVINLFSSTATH